MYGSSGGAARVKIDRVLEVMWKRKDKTIREEKAQVEEERGREKINATLRWSCVALDTNGGTS